jgi:hypothetical protein
MPRAERNRHLFASAIAGLSGSTTSRRLRAGADPSTPFVVGEETERATTRTETSYSSNYDLFIDILILLLKTNFHNFKISPQVLQIDWIDYLKKWNHLIKKWNSF